VSISDLKSLTLGKAYWIYTSYDCSITFKGTRVYTLGIVGLNQGWNAVGFGKGFQVKDLKNSCNSISSVYVFENGNWKKLGDEDYLTVGKGYWVYAKKDCVILLKKSSSNNKFYGEYSGVTAQTSTNQINLQFKKGWNLIGGVEISCNDIKDSCDPVYIVKTKQSKAGCFLARVDGKWLYYEKTKGNLAYWVYCRKNI